MTQTSNLVMAPNFKSQIEATKAIANPQVAVADISVDNSLDAGSTKINITSLANEDGTYDLYTSDNGCGMTLNRLMSAMKLGSSQKDNQTGDQFGCKGVGMNLGSTYLATNSLKIFTKTKDCKKINYGVFDISRLYTHPLLNNWHTLYSFEELELETIEHSIVRNHLKCVKSGTVILLETINKKKCGTKNKFDNKMLDHKKGLGFIFRHVLQERDVEIFYNSRKIQSTGFGFDTKETYHDKVFFKDQYVDGWIHDKVSIIGYGEFNIRYRFVRTASARSLRTSGQGGGLCILRNGRDVSAQLLSGIKPNRFEYGHTVIELNLPSALLDIVLGGAGDKQIRTIENQLEDFDFVSYFSDLFVSKGFWSKIAHINAADAIASGAKKDKETAWKYEEKILVGRYYEQVKEYKGISHSVEDLSKNLIKEYNIPGTSFRVDLVDFDQLYEFKISGDDPSKTVGQILSYAPYLIEDKTHNFVKNNVLGYNLFVGSKPTVSMERHIEKVNSSIKFGDISIHIKLIDMTKTHPKLLKYSLTKEEKEITEKVT